VLLYACCLSSGLVDSTLYNGKQSRYPSYPAATDCAAYNTFVSMQTGKSTRTTS
jgi:hypothetical protein